MKFTNISFLYVVCQPGWTHNSKTFKCYKFVEKAGDWADAHNNCHAMAPKTGTTGPLPITRVGLVSIRDAEENLFVARDIAKGRYILTGGDRLVDGTWIWTDGSKWGTYLNWRAPEPNNWRGVNGAIRENSLKLNYQGIGGWNDGFYRGTNTYVCQYLDINQFK